MCLVFCWRLRADPIHLAGKPVKTGIPERVTAVALAIGRLRQPTSTVAHCPQVWDNKARANRQKQAAPIHSEDQKFTFL